MSKNFLEEGLRRRITFATCIIFSVYLYNDLLCNIYHGIFFGSHFFRQDPDSPFSVGRGDLDPFGAGMGGMLFDPMRGGRGPRFGLDPSAGLPSRLPP